MSGFKTSTGSMLRQALAGSILSMLPVYSYANSCIDTYKEPLSTAIENKDVAEINGFFNNSKLLSICSDEWVKQMKSVAIGSIANSASQLQASGQVEEARRLVMGEGDAQFMQTQEHWMKSAVLGDISHAQKEWGKATTQYGRAHELAAGAGLSDEIQLQLFDLSSEALRLHGKIDAAVSRSGEPSGMLSSRGVKPQSIPVPVTFDFGSADLTEDGVNAARVLAKYLQKNKAPAVWLTGHTDYCGSEVNNQNLSNRRASVFGAAVSDEYYILTQSEIQVNTLGAGESCPPLVQSDYEDSLFRKLSRRVEFSVVSAGDERSLCNLEFVSPTGSAAQKNCSVDQ